MVQPPALSEANPFQNLRRSTGSMPTVGSSRISSGGRPTSATARDSLRRIPPEKKRTAFFFSSFRPTKSSSSAARARAAAGPRPAMRPKNARVRRGQIVVKRVVLRHVADLPERVEGGHGPA
jgi:hypothetical protein